MYTSYLEHPETRPKLWCMYLFFLVFSGLLGCWLLSTSKIVEGEPIFKVVHQDLIHSTIFSKGNVIEEIELRNPKPPILTYDSTPEEIDEAIDYICWDLYHGHIDPDVIKAVVWVESRYFTGAVNYSSGCLGLMQINPTWQGSRMEELGVTDLQDPYSNLLVGIDYLSDLCYGYEDDPYCRVTPIDAALMNYGMGWVAAGSYIYGGYLSGYAIAVETRVHELKTGGE